MLTLSAGCRRFISASMQPKTRMMGSSSKSSISRLNEIPAIGTMTKIVCTMGPATDQPLEVAGLINNGMNVARLNFSHAGTDYSYPEKCMDLVRSTPGKHDLLATGAVVSQGMPRNLRAILVDTKGPEIRTGVLQAGMEVLEIKVGDTVELTTQRVGDEPVSENPNEHRVHVDYMSIAKTMKVGGLVLIDDGLIALEVESIGPNFESITCKALNGGPVKKNKGVNLPGMELDLPALTEKDKNDLRWACEVGADYVAASFIRTPGNVRSVIAYLDRCVAQLAPTNSAHSPLRPLVISKIESKEGVDNFYEILKESDGIMVARGDLGVEIPYSKVFAAQKMMVSACNEAGKPVIVATQMLDSMMRNPRPTRAEVTDVGTAVLDGADAVMLSGETAAGKYPIESIQAMRSVVWEADQIMDARADIVWSQKLHDGMSPSDQEMDAVAASACMAAIRMDAKVIVLITTTGKVARAVSRHRPTVPILAFCTDPQVGRRLQLHRGITPIVLQSPLDPGSASTSMGLLRAEAVRTAKELGFTKAGDRIIMVDRSAGKEHDMHHYSNNMKVVTLR